jgi:Na+/H+-translocating membrane pyrophosphatase
LVSNQDETPEAPTSGAGSWSGAAAIAGAAIGSAAVAAALLFASRRKDRADKAKIPAPTAPLPETD